MDNSTARIRGQLLAIVLVLALIATVISVRVALDPPAPQPLPSPNGADYFLMAGRAIAADPRFYYEMPVEQLRPLVESNGGAIELVREGLRYESRIRFEYTEEWFRGHVGDLMSQKSVAMTIAAASRLAHMEERHADAAELALLGVQFSHEASRGGGLINALVSMSTELMALGRLKHVTNSLSASECRDVTIKLTHLDQSRPNTDEFVAINNRYWREAIPLHERLKSMVEERSIHANDKSNEQVIQTLRKADFERRQLILLFAARAYELEKGHKPAQASDLVPEHLEAIPKDPETGVDLPLP
jgi:hypothetical protein